ncbi:hypothetical protein T310_7823 [Rasamsonia emersonii CBS 393.64]|uniref:Uncharacterized protein n=1 Tax=Rasamsonia emersonii (strain ATCC 16479 / CBS 393.64 / IMI 116815) TaxID=1408163 RepID=A0A0F4YJF3_RASE3|nr:hypothetical protein T310_7823 [Rasamsonia emersonii CBS 393.64]KKA18230.1 hypothetical protein T310_7823 [Rasamsonia emersonii CBS 393.64]
MSEPAAPAGTRAERYSLSEVMIPAASDDEDTDRCGIITPLRGFPPSSPPPPGQDSPSPAPPLVSNLAIPTGRGRYLDFTRGSTKNNQQRLNTNRTGYDGHLDSLSRDDSCSRPG